MQRKSVRGIRANSRLSKHVTYDRLEGRMLLAGLADVAAISDPFALDAVTYEQMVGRAAVNPYIAGQVVVAIQTPNASDQAPAAIAEIDWAALTGVESATAIRNLMSTDRGANQSVTLVHLDLGESSDIFAAMRQLDKQDAVMWSAPNFYQDIDPREYTPNDPEYPNQYHHPLMQNDDAWDITFGDSSIVVGITDDGVSLTHSDLAGNIWTNTADFPNGIDDDGNGYVDDINGWDFSSGNNDPNPNNGDTHGSHVAGIVAADTDNNTGVAGTAGEATIMPLQFYGVGSWTAAVINETFAYAVDNGANIVNTSYNIDGWWGDPVFTAGLQYMYDNGVLHFNSAGNGGSLNTARQGFDQTLLVVNTDSSDNINSGSNYGTGVDISAPGTAILSTVTSGGYEEFTGTSMAAPNAAGVAALIWSHNPTWSHIQVAAQLLGTADNIDALNPGFEGYLGAGRANSFRSLTETLAAPQMQYVEGLPADGDLLDDETIDSFTIAFDQVMDDSSANTTANYELREAGADDLFGTADDTIYTLSHETYMMGTNAFEFVIEDGPMPYGHYELTISSNLVNPFGAGLDGDGDGVSGDDYRQEFWISPPIRGEVSFHRNSYLEEDSIQITVVDANVTTTSVTVEVTSTGGDSEMLTLSADGPGVYIGTINSVAGAPTPGDGQLGVALGQQLTVTYIDTDDGTGTDYFATDTASISNILEFPATDLPLDITSNTTITSMIDITDFGSVADIDVKLDITHTYDGDLEVFLISPGGDRIELFQRVGGSDDNFTGTILDDEASIDIGSGTAPFTGSFRPVGNLSDLDSLSINGIWTLEVTDALAGDVGTLNAWSLCIDVVSPEIGAVYLDSSSYNAGDTVGITVVDANAPASISVTVVSDSGDQEVITMTDQGNGTYVSSVPSAAGAAQSGDGIIQADIGETFTVTYVDNDTGQGQSDTFSDTANIRNVLNYISDDVPLDILDNATLRSELVITDTGTVADVDILFDITHTYAADLDVFLEAPDGTRVELFQDIGGSGDNFTQTLLDDEATTAVASGAAPFTGSFSPVGSLSDFDGMSITGTWILEISDDAGSDQGTLNAWSMAIDVIPDSTLEVDVVGPATAIAEGDGGSETAVFTISLSEESDSVVTVDYATTTAGYTNPATAGLDFSPASGTVTFQPGETTASVSVSVSGDQLGELDEEFGLELSNATGGASVGVGLGGALIQDDEPLIIRRQHIDFGPDDGVVEGNDVGLNDLNYTVEKGYGWASHTGLQTTSFTRAIDSVRADVARFESGHFALDIGNDDYRVKLVLGDQGVVRDQMQITIEGQVVDLVDTSAGGFVDKFYFVTVTDNQLNIEIDDLGGANDLASIAGLSFIRQIGVRGVVAGGKSLSATALPSNMAAIAQASGLAGLGQQRMPLKAQQLADTPIGAIEPSALFGSLDADAKVEKSDRRFEVQARDSSQAKMLVDLMDEFVSGM